MGIVVLDAHTHDELINFNPFTDSDGLDDTAHETIEQPPLKRHASEDMDREHVQERFFHPRSQTVDDQTGHNHPLKAANSIKDAASVTRPHLRRLLSDFDSSVDNAAESSEGEHLSTGQSSLQEGEHKSIIIHDVSSTDTIAGVALKYGLTVSSLRRANQMWASDSIHLRKQLHIPLERTSLLKEHSFEDRDPQLLELANDVLHSRTTPRVPDAPHSFLPSSSGSSSSITHVDPSLSTSSAVSTSTSLTKYNTVAVPRRPRPSHDALPQFSSTQSISPVSRSPPLASGPLSQGRSSLFTTTRDTFDRFARLSLESNGTSSSTPTVSDEQEHELDDISSSRIRSRLHSRIASVPLDRHKSLSEDSAKSFGSYVMSRPYVPQVDDGFQMEQHVRTSQMEPSPVMQLPLLPPRTSSRSRSEIPVPEAWTNDGDVG